MAIIKLDPEAKADAGHCGSCRYFRRNTDHYLREGSCRFEPPPHLSLKDWDGEGAPPRNTHDFDACSLWQASGDTYEQVVTWKVER